MNAQRKNSVSPLDLLMPYQRRWIDDDGRFKIGLMARQSGKSWTSAMEAVRDCGERKTTWVCLSRGERQSLEWMEKAKEHIKAFRISLAGYTEDRGGISEALLKIAEARFPNGSRIIALPANPDTARGYTGNLLLDEFAFHENPDAIWRAIYPSITNPLKGIFKIRVVSTPNGLGNKFADLWRKPDGVKMKWSRHKVTIHDAIAQGLPVDAEELREGLDDGEGWAQEFECEFMDAAAVLLPYELLATCESPEATTAAGPEYFNGSKRYVVGIDFARKRDLSVAWTDELLGNVTHCREVLEMRDLSTPDQIDLLRPRIRRARRVCLDYTGPGVGMGDYLVKEFGEYNPQKHQFGKIELCVFTNALKVEMFSKLRMAFEQQRTRIPVNRAIREDFHSLQRVTSNSGNVTYRAPHNADGHADRCTAKALAQRAAGSGTAPVACAPVSNAFVSPRTNIFGIGRVRPTKGAPL